MKTNVELVKHAEMALSEKWGYVWGTFGRFFTKELFEQKLKQFPSEVGKYKDFISKNWVGRKTCDCIGLIKSYLWSEKGVIEYDADTDVNVGGMYNRATVKGLLATMPDKLGILVMMPGHVGIYVGNGMVIEARGTKFGVVKTPLRGTGANLWTKWCECPFIVYPTLKPAIKPLPDVKPKPDVRSIDDILHQINKSVSLDTEYWSDVVKGSKIPTKENIYYLLVRMSGIEKSTVSTPVGTLLKPAFAAIGKKTGTNEMINTEYWTDVVSGAEIVTKQNVYYLLCKMEKISKGV